MSESAGKAVFLSYASQDADAARRICDAMRAAGVEVWFDQSELRGGDSWDQKIRKQIKECALFVPIVSANTEARLEGYFRLEWKLADDRTHLMAKGTPYLVPVCVDETKDGDARVPDSFLAVQWTRLLRTEDAVAFGERIRTILGGPVARSSPAAREFSRQSGTIPRRRRFPVSWAIVAIACVGGAAWWTFSRQPRSVAPVPVETLAANEHSVVVLPFKNLSGDPQQEYFSDGLTEEVLNALAREHDLRVIPRTSAFAFKDEKISISEIARRLNVAQVVEGSVQRSGTRVRIRCTITRVKDGYAEALAPIDRESGDVFALQDDVARVVVKKLTRRDNPIGSPLPTKSPAAYDAFLQGRAAMSGTRRSSEDRFLHFQRAVEFDPEFALAWAYYARTSVESYAASRSGPSLKEIRGAIDIALRLRPDLPEAHLAHAYFLQETYAPVAAVARALDIAEKGLPNDPEVLLLRAKLFRQRRDLRITVLERVVAMDPLDGRNVNQLGIALIEDGQYARAEDAFRRAAAIRWSAVSFSNIARSKFGQTGDRAIVLAALDAIPPEEQGQVRTMRAYLLFSLGDFESAWKATDERDEEDNRVFSSSQHPLRGRIREAMGDVEGARREYTEVLPRAIKAAEQFAAVPKVHAWLALIYAGLGREEEALGVARLAVKLVRPQDYPNEAADELTMHPINALAHILARFGHTDEAIAIVRQQVAEGWWRHHYLRLSPDWAVLRKDPRFREIMEKAPR